MPGTEDVRWQPHLGSRGMLKAHHTFIGDGPECKLCGLKPEKHRAKATSNALSMRDQ
jgi:hypothetical protein